jgi:transcriptional regulator with XRE-family HTH domain
LCFTRPVTVYWNREKGGVVQILYGQVLRQARELLGIPQALVAREGGVSHSTLSQAEADLVELSAAATMRVCRFLCGQLAQKLGMYPPEMDTFRECIEGLQLLLAQGQISRAIETIDSLPLRVGA